VDQARANLALAQARFANTRIESPGPGRVLTRDVEPGDAVQPGRVLLTVALDGPTQLTAVPDERDIAWLREGQPATASADPYPSQRFPARVSYIAPAIDPEQGTVEIRLDVDSPPPYLRPDMTVSVQVTTATRAGALVVPVEVVQDPQSPTPWVRVVRNGRIARQDVTLGVRGERYAEIRGGLAEDDAVVASSTGIPALGRRARAAR
jgi:HlyD family secretion protein